MKTPYKWRKGYTVLQYIKWLRLTNKVDPEYISDEEWDRLYDKFLNLNH